MLRDEMNRPRWTVAIYLIFFLLFIHTADAAFICDEAHNMFQCKNRQCVGLGDRCNFRIDCLDKSDELECDYPACNSKDEFTCDNKKCVYKTWVCDESDDCFDGSDENPEFCSNHSCTPEEFQCSSGPCLPIGYKCDGEFDCDGGEDEEGCNPVECESDETRCANGRECIVTSSKCDGEDDCFDGSDEDECVGVTCQVDEEFACKSGDRCILLTWKCNGLSDCPDGSDEMDCDDDADRCGSGYFSCRSSTMCIPDDWHCNGEADCPGGSDELHCDNIKDSCPEGDRLCANQRQCINKRKFCDGVRDCIDKSDELECPAHILPDSDCPPLTHFQCPGEGGKCILEGKLCDGYRDCSGGEDENKGPHFCGFDECGSGSLGNCTHICINKRLGYECDCPAGLELEEDGTSCRDIDECSNVIKPCDTHCMNTDGSYKCMCDEGYTLMHGKHCKPINATYDVTLLVADRNKIEKIIVDKGPVVRPLVTKINVHSVAVDIKNDYFYWSDAKNEAISRSKLSSPKVTEVILDKKVVKNPRGLSVDWIHGLLFWIDTRYNTLSAVSLTDHLHPKTLYETTGSMLISVAVHPGSGSIYMGYPVRSGGDAGLIERCGMDGNRSSCVKIITERISYPSDIAIDFDQDLLYWVDCKLNILVVSDLDGKSRRDVVIVTHVPFSVAVFSGRVYFTDSRHHQLVSTNRTFGEMRIVKSKLSSEADVAIMNSGAQADSPNFCDGSTCDMMCLPQATSAKATLRTYSCVCPDHFTKNADGNGCISTTTTSSTITKKGLTTRFDTTSRDAVTHAVSDSSSSAVTSASGSISSAHVIIIIGVIGLVVLIGVILWVFIRRRRQRSARMSMNFNNPIYKKVNQSIASSSSFPDQKKSSPSESLSDPSPATSSGDIASNGTAVLVKNEELPDGSDPNVPMVAEVKFTSGGKYAKVPNGDAELRFPENNFDHR